MGLISQSIPNLLNGVSQLAPALRSPSEVAEQINMLSHPTFGVMKRPPSVRLASVGASGGTGSAFLHTVNRDAADRYRAVIVNGAITVHDAVTGASITVDTPGGTDYLTASDPENDFRAVTIGDKTYIVNRTVVVKGNSSKSKPSLNEALVSIRQADFATLYNITLDSTTIGINTPDGSTPHDRGLISTNYIASELAGQIAANPELTGFAVTQYGSSLYIVKTDGSDFAISASDGLADQAILAIKGSVQRFDDLPERAKKGVVVEITGDPTNQFDNYYVVYDDNGAPNLAGVWRETVAPDILTDLDATTMPHLLSLDGALLDGVTAVGLPAGPVIASAANGTLQLEGWTTGNETFNPAWSYSLNDQAEWAAATLAVLNGAPATVNAYFDADTTALAAGSNATVELWASNAAHTVIPAFDSSTCTRVSAKTYQAGLMQYDEVLSAVGSWPINTCFYIRLMYAAGATPDKYHVCEMRLHVLGQIGHQPLEISVLSGTQLTLDVDVTYPAGTTFEVTADGGGIIVPATETYLLTADAAGAAIATAISALFVGSAYTTTTPSAGVILFTAATSVPVVTCALSFDTTHTLYNSDLSLVTGSLVGKIVENLSDGCSGTITSNTATEIVVSAGLTGGVNNVFTKGDLCRVVGAGVNFTFDVALWKGRTVGDLVSNANPSFVGQTIQSIFFNKNRLCFTAGQNFIASMSSDSLNFFRQTVTQVLPDDVIDVQSANQMLSRFHSAVQWGGSLLLWSDEGQYEVQGAPALSPQTVGILPLSQFTNAAKCPPLVAGKHILFARTRGSATQVFEYAVVNVTGTPDAEETTRNIPTYIQGNPIQMAGDSALGLLAVRTDAADNVLYVQHFAFENQSKIQEAWGKWVFDTDCHILAMDVLDGVLALVVRRSTGVYIEQISLVVQAADTVGEYLDARQGTAGAYTGIVYPSRIDLSPMYMRRYSRWGNISPTTAGRLIIRYLTARYHESRALTASVTPTGGATTTYPFASATQADGNFRIPVMAVNTEVVVSIGNNTSDGFRLSGLDWEGTYHNRAAFV